MFGCVSAVHGGVPADGISMQQQRLLLGRLKLFFRPGSLSPSQEMLPLLCCLAHMELRVVEGWRLSGAVSHMFTTQT